MLEKSVFSKKEIIEQVDENYGIIINKIEKEPRGSANIYYIYDKENNKYVLKEFESACNEQNVLKEINIINYLQKYNIKVPEYIKTIDNQYYFNYKNRTVILMKYIQGYTKNSNTGNYAQTLESAEILGKIVKALEEYPCMEQEDIEKWYNKTKIVQGKQKIIKLMQDAEQNTNINENIKEKIIRDAYDKLEIIQQLEKMNFEGIQYVTNKNSHGDFSIMQFIYQDEKVCAVLDFAKAKSFPISWEIIRSYSYIDKCCKDGEINLGNLKAYVRTIMKYIELTKYDLKFMPYTYLIQLVTSPFGYNEYLNNNELTSLLDFAIWRTNMSKYLFKNLDKISEELLQLK